MARRSKRERWNGLRLASTPSPLSDRFSESLASTCSSTRDRLDCSSAGALAGSRQWSMVYDPCSRSEAPWRVFLPKPFGVDQLSAALDSALAERQAQESR